MGEYTLEKINIENDHVTGTITVPDQRILQFSIPYSKGWKVMIDGENVDLLCSDIMYMAIPVSEGTHIVELEYETPYFRIGIYISVITFISWVAYELVNKRSNT